MARKYLGPCARLDDEGHRCRSLARYKGNYHGDNEIYSRMDTDAVTWVQIALCETHAKAARLEALTPKKARHA